MYMYLDCYPCVLRHAVDVARRTTNDEQVQYNIMKKVVQELERIPREATPPEITARIHRIIKKATGNPDPYEQVKRLHNEIALQLYPKLKKRIESSDIPLFMAAKLAIAGNIMDSGASGGEFDLNTTIEETLAKDLVGEPFHSFENEIMKASDLLYLGDNAGEIVFDRILIEEIQERSKPKVTFVVKGEPILNDATLEDALFVGMDGLTEIIANGYDAPATILDKASSVFKEAWKSADLIIAKGQGNYESLSEVRGNIFFLLKVKCPALARDIGWKVGENVLTRGKRQQ